MRHDSPDTPGRKVFSPAFSGLGETFAGVDNFSRQTGYPQRYPQVVHKRASAVHNGALWMNNTVHKRSASFPQHFPRDTPNH